MTLSPWIESILVLLLAGSGLAIALSLSRLKSPWWTLGYFIPLALIVTIGVGRRLPETQFYPPISWLLAGRTEFALSGMIACLILGTPMSRLPTLRERRALLALMLFVTLSTSVWPFAAPAFNTAKLLSTPTNWDQDRICRQTTDYTCGPAAAVTALDRLGIHAEEGQLAVLAHTSNAIGTPEDLLTLALQKQYSHLGLQCEFRYFNSYSELPKDTLTLAVIQFGLLVDHYILILSISDQGVEVADPLQGKRHLSQEEFNSIWRKTGIVLRRTERQLENHVRTSL